MPLTRSKSLPATDVMPANGGSNREKLESGRSVAGILYKWTNYGKGWRSRWFLLRDGILSYSKIRRPENVNLVSPSDDVRLIGDISTDRLTRMNSCSGRGGRRKHHKTIGIVHLKVLGGSRAWIGAIGAHWSKRGRIRAKRRFSLTEHLLGLLDRLLAPPTR